MELPEKPQEAILKVGFSDGIYGHSKGGVTPSGWQYEHLPYLVEIDNWGVSHGQRIQQPATDPKRSAVIPAAYGKGILGVNDTCTVAGAFISSRNA